MLLIGAGSLLRYALEIAGGQGIKVDLVCSGQDAGLGRFCSRHDVPFMLSRDINQQLEGVLSTCSDGLAFSINNSSILSDEILSTDVQFFNIHNGLVQQYRGIAEVCVLASICSSETIYGSTLHRLLPGQQVDAGPVLSQSTFEVSPSQNFESFFTKSIENYKKLLRSSFHELDQLPTLEGSYLHGDCVYLYRDVKKLLMEAPPERRVLASELGKYSGLLPKLSRCIADFSSDSLS